MPAANETFPWMSYYNNYNFFEQRMNEHSKVKTVSAIDSIRYRMDLVDGKSVTVFICECYSFGVAEYMEVLENCGPVDIVVISSFWCGYTMDAKYHCAKKCVGLFNLAGLMSALNKSVLHRYLTKDEKEYFEKMGWSV